MEVNLTKPVRKKNDLSPSYFLFSEMEIPLRNKDGDIIAHAIVDPEIYEEVTEHRWWGVRVRGQGDYKYAMAKIDRKIIQMHHFVFKKPDGNNVIDHLNGNGLDNRRCNLREVTKQQNSQNKKTKYKYKGVYPRGNKYICICCDVCLGTHDTEIEAAKRYDIYVYLTLGSQSLTNGLISYEDAMKYKLEDIVLGVQRKYDLPKYITFDKQNKKYYVNLYHKNKRYRSKLLATVDEAQVLLDEYLKQIEEVKQKDLEDHYKQPIQYNEDGIAIVTICGGQVAYVDDDIWHDVMKYKWCSAYGYAQAKTPVKKNTRMHQFIYYTKKGHIPPLIDHVNKNKLDNRIANLLEKTSGENAHNRTKLAIASSKYYGVSFQTASCRWRAALKKDGVNYYLGEFKTEIEAARAYNVKAQELYGSNANLNDI